MKTYWLTKYALSTGISEFQGEPYLTKYIEHGMYGLRILGTDCHETREAAIAYADGMRKRKIEALKKQIAKLEALSFTDSEMKG